MFLAWLFLPWRWNVAACSIGISLPLRRLPALLLNHLGGGGALDFVQGIETSKYVVVQTSQELSLHLLCPDWYHGQCILLQARG